ncbi:hypothetical protein [Roseisolibacter agri]|uniref:Uncharacterized protein n=1 Tax=Roseisolibacter agri TaxID=2014610 RepID=A0AA37V2D3_9BACT|nr:hypothetical protein [Roseisolibacter agri]GLC27625.1 hypothetical protein rosag_41380 [Roseisolibacter agri]
MPQPAPAPPAPPAPDAPPAAQPTAAPVAVSLPDGPLPLQDLPKNAQEVRGLRERRDILRDQLERATNRRDELARELDGGGEGEQRLSSEARVGIQQRLQVLDGRILQIERDQAMTERLLSQAPPAVLASLVQQERQERALNNRVDEDEAIGMAFGMFGFGIVLTLVIGRIRQRLARRRGGPASATATATLVADPRFDQLAHAVNSIAEEVERIGEGQRFVTQLLASRSEAPALRGEQDVR